MPHQLAHWGLIPPYDVIELDHYWLRQWPVAYLAPNHSPKHWYNCTLRNTFKWNFSQLEKVVFKKTHLIMSSANEWPICLDLNVVNMPKTVLICCEIQYVVLIKKFILAYNRKKLFDILSLHFIRLNSYRSCLIPTALHDHMGYS